ncbi:type II secretion system protein GspM [Ectopseudomonas chengduensis]|nr:type II secretion system protein GspM [Pseudomonas chengduensis]UZT80840.1 type II secretion system protein GspM [Pseudomonas chengduensis]
MSKLAAYRARWQTQLASAQQFWQRSSARDKRMLRIAAVVLPLCLLWYGFIEPPLSRIDHWNAELPRLRSQLSTLESVLAEVEGPKSSAVQDPEEVLKHYLEAAGAEGTYTVTTSTDAAGTRTVRLTVDAIPADALMNWLLVEAPRLRLGVRTAHLQRTEKSIEAAVLVSGVVTMEQAPGAKESS